MGTPRFRVKAIRPKAVDGRTLTEIDVEVVHDPNVPVNFTWTITGTLTLDPDRDLALRSYRLQSQYFPKDGKATIPFVSIGTVEYQPGPGPATPKRIEFRYGQDPEKPVVTRIVDVTRWDHEPTPAAEFTLDHYGLGDAPKPEAKKP